MGEANELCRRLNLDRTFRVFNSANGTIKCNLFEGKNIIKTLTKDEFDREYKNLRKKFLKVNNVKIWNYT